MKKSLKRNDITFIYLILKSLKYDIYQLQISIYDMLSDEEKKQTIDILKKIEDATQLAERIMLHEYEK